MNSQFKHIGFAALYIIIAVVAWFINMQIGTVVFGLLALRSIYQLFSDKIVEQGEEK